MSSIARSRTASRGGSCTPPKRTTTSRTTSSATTGAPSSTRRSAARFPIRAGRSRRDALAIEPRGRAPHLGEHTRQVLEQDLGLERRTRSHALTAAGSDTMNAPDESPVRPGVLCGIRVLDFTWKTVGPWAPRLLTHYGAEVIHVERAGGLTTIATTPRRASSATSRRRRAAAHEEVLRPDPQFNTLATSRRPRRRRRSSTPRRTSTRCTTASSRSASTRSIPRASKLVERLIGICDALVENFSAEVLPSWGLTWERIHELNPRLVYMSTSGFGHTGEWKGYRSFGPTAAGAVRPVARVRACPASRPRAGASPTST